MLTKATSFSSSHATQFSENMDVTEIVFLSFAAVSLVVLICMKIFFKFSNNNIIILRKSLGISLIIMIIFHTCLFNVKPFGLNNEAKVMKHVAMWLKNESLLERNALYVPHPWLYYFLDIDFYSREKDGSIFINKNAVDNSVSGSLLLWNSHYGVRESEHIKEYIENNDHFKVLKIFYVDDKNQVPFVYVYEKL